MVENWGSGEQFISLTVKQFRGIHVLIPLEKKILDLINIFYLTI